MSHEVQRTFLGVNLAIILLLAYTANSQTTDGPVKVQVVLKPYNAAVAARYTYTNTAAATTQATTDFCAMMTGIWAASSDLATYATCVVSSYANDAAASGSAIVTGYVTFASSEASNRLTAGNARAYLLSGQTLFGTAGNMNIKVASASLSTDLVITVTGTSVSSLSGAKSGAKQYGTSLALIGGSLIPVYLYKVIAGQC